MPKSIFGTPIRPILKLYKYLKYRNKNLDGIVLIVLIGDHLTFDTPSHKRFIHMCLMLKSDGEAHRGSIQVSIIKQSASITCIC